MNQELNDYLNSLNVPFYTSVTKNYITPIRLHIKGKTFLLQGDETPEDLKTAFKLKYNLDI